MDDKRRITSPPLTIIIDKGAIIAVYGRMKKQLIFPVFMLLLLPISGHAQSNVQGLNFYPSFIYLHNNTGSGGLPCYNSDGWHCKTTALNTYAVGLDYWRRTMPSSSPFYFEGGLGLRYVPTEVKQFSSFSDADTASILLYEEWGSYKSKSVYGHVLVLGGFRFPVKDIPVEVYGGISANLPLYGRRMIHVKSRDYFDGVYAYDSICQCDVYHRIPLDEPFDTIIADWAENSSLHTRFQMGGVMGVRVELPTKGKRSLSLGYQYERVLNDPDFYSFKIRDYNSLTLSVGLGQKQGIPAERSSDIVKKYRGFVLGTQMGIQRYDDGHTKNLLFFDFNFGYNTASGIRPEIILTSYHHWSGEEISGISIGGGISLELLKGYLVPSAGGTFGIYTPWGYDSFQKIRALYVGAGLQYPNTGRFRIKFSTLAHYWHYRSGWSSSRMSFDLGGYYFFGKQI